MGHWIATEMRHLRGKLALAYTLTTTSMLAVFLLLLVAVLLNDALNQDQHERQIGEALDHLAQQVAPVLADAPIDRQRLSVLLVVALERTGLWGMGTVASSDDLTAPDLHDGASIVIVDPGGTIIASTRLDGGSALGQPVSALGIPGLAGEQVREPAGGVRTRRLADGTIVAVAPVASGRPLGTIVYVSGYRADAWPFLIAVGQSFGSAVAVGAAAAALVGLAFGLTVAGGLTRRLRTIEHVSAAWGRGDFTPRLDDQSSDEIGQLSRQLNAVADQLQRLIRERQQFATLEERNRLARDLHDSVKQHVFAVTMGLGAAEALWRDDPAAAAALTANAAATAGAAQRELTAIIHALRPAALERAGLAQAIGDMVAQWTDRQPIRVTQHLDPVAGLAPDHEELLFRIAQEALANVARHSRATRATVELRRVADTIVLRVGDNGRGFDVAAAPRGLGLQSMRERVAVAGATLTITSGGAGTTVEVVLGATTSDTEAQ